MAIGTVQKILGSVTRVSQTEFKANYGDDEKGRQAGVYPSVRAAQQVIEQSALGGRRGNWERAVREDGVEAYLLKSIITNSLPSGLGYITINGSTPAVLPGFSLGYGSIAGFDPSGNPVALAPAVVASDYVVCDGTGWITGMSYAGSSVLLGQYAGLNSKFNLSTCVGFQAASFSSQNSASVAVGYEAGYSSQQQNATAVGYRAGYSIQNLGGVAIGHQAGANSQQSLGTAVGYLAGQGTQGNGATAVGGWAGNFNQGQRAVSVGQDAGRDFQGASSVAIGYQAGFIQQGQYCIAIGHRAAPGQQFANSIVLNATGADASTPATSSFVVKPVRGRVVAEQVTTLRSVSYDTSSGEFVYLSSAPLPAALGGYKSITSAVSPYSVTPTDYFVDLTSGTATATLPSAVGIAGRIYSFKLSVAGENFTVNAAAGQTIDGSASVSASAQWSTLSVISDGANWKRITATGF